MIIFVLKSQGMNPLPKSLKMTQRHKLTVSDILIKNEHLKQQSHSIQKNTTTLEEIKLNDKNEYPHQTLIRMIEQQLQKIENPTEEKPQDQFQQPKAEQESCQIDTSNWGSTVFKVYKWIVSDKKIYIREVTNEGASGLYEIKVTDNITKPTAYRRCQVYKTGKVLEFDPENNNLKMQLETKEINVPIEKANQKTAIKRNKSRISATTILSEYKIKLEDGVKIENYPEETTTATKTIPQQYISLGSGCQQQQVKNESCVNQKVAKQKKKSKSKKKKKDRNDQNSSQSQSKKKTIQQPIEETIKTEVEEHSIKEQKSNHQKKSEQQFPDSNDLKDQIQEKPMRKKGRRRTKKEIQQAKEEHQKKIKLMMEKDERTAREEAEIRLRIQKQLLARFGTKIRFQVDQNCKHRSQFRIKADTVQKRGKLYSQIYSSNPMLSDQKSYFQIGMKSLAAPNITIGVITAENFNYDYSLNKKGCICFDAYSRGVYVEGEKTEYDVNVFVNDVIRIIVDLPEKKIQWFLNNDCFAVTTIPETLASQTLYPHLETSNKGVKLKTNRVDE